MVITKIIKWIKTKKKITCLEMSTFAEDCWKGVEKEEGKWG